VAPRRVLGREQEVGRLGAHLRHGGDGVLDLVELVAVPPGDELDGPVVVGAGPGAAARPEANVRGIIRSPWPHPGAHGRDARGPSSSCSSAVRRAGSPAPPTYRTASSRTDRAARGAAARSPRRTPPLRTPPGPTPRPWPRSRPHCPSRRGYGRDGRCRPRPASTKNPRRRSDPGCRAAGDGDGGGGPLVTATRRRPGCRPGPRRASCRRPGRRRRCARAPAGRRGAAPGRSRACRHTAGVVVGPRRPGDVS